MCIDYNLFQLLPSLSGEENKMRNVLPTFLVGVQCSDRFSTIIFQGSSYVICAYII